MNRNYLVWAMMALALVGLIDSAYLAYLSLSPPTSCPVGEFSIFSCNEVIYSQYSHVYGISVAMLGLGWFILALGLILVAWRNARVIYRLLSESMGLSTPMVTADIAVFPARSTTVNLIVQVPAGTSPVSQDPNASFQTGVTDDDTVVQATGAAPSPTSSR